MKGLRSSIDSITWNLKQKMVGIIIIAEKINVINADNVNIIIEVTKMWRFEGWGEWEEV